MDRTIISLVDIQQFYDNLCFCAWSVQNVDYQSA